MKKLFVFLGMVTMMTTIALAMDPVIQDPTNNKAKGDTIPAYQEPYRPQIHFTPRAHWNNDPNGMVYYAGIYHLFFQYYPIGTQWGPMHWGHAVSKDLLHWDEKPVALFPDSLGYIFSGSAVVDEKNTSGFGKNGVVPLVAIFTYHDQKGADAGRDDFETQGIAYSLDSGKTWVKYSGNPVVDNPGIRDYRDPKVRWYEPTKRWIMTLATKDRITFFSSPDLKSWKKESEFGQDMGSHGGVWECPDLLLVKAKSDLNKTGKDKWVLTVNVGSGAPNGGSGTQYFTGSFDGHEFSTVDTITKWLDYGPDEYAGVTWSHTGDDLLFLGWMSNTHYAGATPTSSWRGGMTLPRKLGLVSINGHDYVTSAALIKVLKTNTAGHENLKRTASGKYQLEDSRLRNPFLLEIAGNNQQSFSIKLTNKSGDKLILGYDKERNAYYIDRKEAGKTDFSDGFGSRSWAPRLGDSKKMDLQLVFDKSSVELFADGGKTSMTALFFVADGFSKMEIGSKNGIKLQQVTIDWLQSIWKNK